MEKAAAPFDYATNAHLLIPSMMQEKIYFVGEGVVMSHYKTKTKQFVNWFAAAGDFATAVESFHYQRPSREYLTACTRVRGMSIMKIEYDNLIQKFPSLAILVRKVTLHYLLQSQLRLHNVIMFDTYERYCLFVEERPDLLRDLPDKLIAAYLNMDPATLSKVRKKYRDRAGR